VVYQRTESFIECADYDPPETATPEPDDEPTGVAAGWTAVEPVEFDVVPVDAAELAVAPEAVVAVPGIV